MFCPQVGSWFCQVTDEVCLLSAAFYPSPRALPGPEQWLRWGTETSGYWQGTGGLTRQTPVWQLSQPTVLHPASGAATLPSGGCGGSIAGF